MDIVRHKVFFSLKLKVLSVEVNCMCRTLTYTDNDSHINLGFKYPPQTMVFTLNLDSRITYLHRQWFQSLNWIHKKVNYTNKSSITFQAKVDQNGIPLLYIFCLLLYGNQIAEENPAANSQIAFQAKYDASRAHNFQLAQ